MPDLEKYMVPITRENIYTLQPGEWIWDSKLVKRREHKRTLWHKEVTEPVGFVLVHILDLKYFNDIWFGSNKPFMLVNIDNGSYWEYFEAGRFWMFKK